MRVLSALACLAALAAFSSSASADTLSVKLFGVAYPSNFDVVASFDITTPGSTWNPGWATGLSYAIDPATFRIEGGVVVSGTTSTAPEFNVWNSNLRYHFQANVVGLPQGNSMECSFSWYHLTSVPSLDLQDQVRYHSNGMLSGFFWQINQPGQPPLIIDFIGMEISYPEPATSFCFGDGATVTCPCNNNSALGSEEGCANGYGYGATLSATGSDTVSHDLLELSLAQARGLQPGMLVQGATQIAAPFKDGILCMGSPTERLEVLFTDSFGEALSTSSLSTVGNVTPGQTRYYQCWYRDPSLSPCGNGSNFSNALRVDWD